MHVGQLIKMLRYGIKILSIAQNVPIMIFTVQPLPPPLPLLLLSSVRDQNKGVVHAGNTLLLLHLSSLTFLL